jgi:hypothetical protein
MKEVWKSMLVFDENVKGYIIVHIATDGVIVCNTLLTDKQKEELRQYYIYNYKPFK